MVSDCDAVANVFTEHHYARSIQEAAQLSVQAGTDWLSLLARVFAFCCCLIRLTHRNCGDAYKYLVEDVQKGSVMMKTIDTSVRRLMKARFQLGEFDPRSRQPYWSLNMSVVDQHVELNRRFARSAGAQIERCLRSAAREGMVLLSNNKGLLPIPATPGKYKTIALMSE